MGCFCCNCKSVTILILIDGFLQCEDGKRIESAMKVTILILIDGFLQYQNSNDTFVTAYVTILILIDGFLQFKMSINELEEDLSQSLF